VTMAGGTGVAPVTQASGERGGGSSMKLQLLLLRLRDIPCVPKHMSM